MILTYEQFFMESQQDYEQYRIPQHLINKIDDYGGTRKYLMNNDPAAEDNLAIRWASQHGHTEIVKLLLQDPRVDPSANNNYPIRWASRYGRTKIVKLLLQDARVDPTAYDNYVIRWASRYGHTETVKLLLQDPRVDPTTRDNHAIQWASLYGRTEIVKLLLQDPRVDPTAKDNLAIRWASEDGDKEIVKLLAQHFCEEELVLTQEEIKDIIKNTDDGIIDQVINIRNKRDQGLDRAMDNILAF